MLYRRFADQTRPTNAISVLVDGRDLSYFGFRKINRPDARMVPELQPYVAALSGSDPSSLQMMNIFGLSVFEGALPEFDGAHVSIDPKPVSDKFRDQIESKNQMCARFAQFFGGRFSKRILEKMEFMFPLVKPFERTLPWHTDSLFPGNKRILRFAVSTERSSLFLNLANLPKVRNPNGLNSIDEICDLINEWGPEILLSFRPGTIYAWVNYGEIHKSPSTSSPGALFVADLDLD